MADHDSTPHPRHVARPPGLHRLSGGASWVDEHGAAVTDQEVLARLRALRVPPAWTHVWAATDAESPIQATGIDSRGRTQYRYSAAAQTQAAAGKFDRLVEFAAALPRLRERIDLDLRVATGATGSSGRTEGIVVMAAVMRLLDRGLFRVGNERYARENHTYGLTTLRRTQVSLRGDTAVFDFVGKEHLAHHVSITDAASARVIRELLRQDRPPSENLFVTSDPPLWRHVDSASVNSYIHAHGAVSASAKTFRTWGATVAATAVSAGAAFAPASAPGSASASASNRRSPNLRPFDAAAFLLGNTPAVARAAYVHPRAIEVGRSSDLKAAVAAAAAAAGTDHVLEILHDAHLQAAVYEGLRA